MTTPENRGGARSGINVTPLIDVLLVLLIIFMVIQPAASRGLDALAPQPPKDWAAQPDPRVLVVSIRGSSAHPDYAVNGQAIAAAELLPSLEKLVTETGRRTLFVDGAAGLDYSDVTPVLNAAHAAGADEVAILTPRSFIPQ